MPTTYFFNDKAGGCTGAASGYDDVLDETTAAGGEIQDTITAGAIDRISYRLTTLTGVPNLTTWQAGDYSVTFDIVERGNNIDVDFNPHRVNSGCTSQADFGLSGEIDPPSVGLNTLTVSGVAEQAAAAGDRLRIDLLIDNDHGHNANTITIDYNDSTVSAAFGIAAARRIFIIS